MNEDMQRPEGALIAAAQERLGISAREAARRAGMSDARYRNIVSGYQSAGAGQRISVVAPADTLGRMAIALGIPASALVKAGRSDASDYVVELLARERELERSEAEIDFVAHPGPARSGSATNDEVLAAIREMRERVDELAAKVDKLTGGEQ